jgi:hypothetical protein
VSAHSHSHAHDAEFLGKNRAATLRNAGFGLLGVGAVLAAAGWASDAHRFVEGYLVGFFYVLTLCLGSLFFVLIQHLTKAGWSVGPRRHAEWVSSFLPFMALLFVPIALSAPNLWHHWWGDASHHDELLAKKVAFLNPTFFYVRAVVYFALWFVMSRFFAATSRRQDVTGDAGLTKKMQVWSAPSVLFFGLSISFAGFDWLMSLDPHWYSTIFGVYVFAGSLVAGFAVLSLFQVSLQKAGILQKVGTVEHRHDLGKQLFGFTVFWAYIGFSQFFLIWYANIPEETVFFTRRWFVDETGAHNSWMPVSLALVFLHFWIPFFLLLPRTVKRTYLGLGLGASLLLFAHYVDLYWVVMPNFDPEFHFSWMDLGGLLLPLGGLVAWIGVRAGKDPVYPLKDPRLSEAYAVANL